MHHKFVTYIKQKGLFELNDHLLVAVSGGVDSIVLCDLLKKSNYKFVVAHCNFKLRGDDSNADEASVKDFCQKNNINFYSRSFDTQKYAQENKLSVQMAARELRYSFFNELTKTHSLKYILTAHHLSDNVETFLINLVRGSGISGLKGISEKRDNVIRPLLSFTKAELIAYAKENSITYRTDQSNFEDHYLRNDLRLNIIPRLKAINPNFEHTLEKEIDLLGQYHSIIKEHFRQEKEKAVIIKGNTININIEKVKQNATPELFLFELLNEFGFHSEVIHDIYESFTGISGKLFYSANYELVKDREYLILKERKENSFVTSIIQKETQEILTPIHLKLQLAKAYVKEDKRSVAYIDSSKIKYPLTIRSWQAGDKFKPLGMNGFKKLSDLFVDLKLNAFEKNSVAVLENGDKEIIWVVNHRIDDRYKITDNTNNILRIELIE